MIATLLLLSLSTGFMPDRSIEGGWVTTESGTTQVSWIFVDGFFAASRYDATQKTFTGTWGGVYRWQDKSIEFTEEFNTIDPAQIGKPYVSSVRIGRSETILTRNGTTQTLRRIDDGTPGALAGAWWITGRMVDGKMNTVTPGARRTMKMLSGKRFQWIAYNVDTREFFGTGGGTYTTVDGRYTEVLDFFSRDNNRVGASLQFDYGLEDGKWRHRGFSSKGDPIDEVWSRRQMLK